MYDDSLMEMLLSEETPSEEQIYKITRQAVLNGATPVYCGSALQEQRRSARA